MRQKEAGQINTSLMHLMRCIEILRYNSTHFNKRIIPYRDTKLTRLFSVLYLCQFIGLFYRGVFRQDCHGYKYQ